MNNNNNNKNDISFTLFSLAIIILILITHFHIIFISNNNNDIDKKFLQKFHKRLKKNIMKENNNNETNALFPLVKEDEDNDNKRRLYNRDIYNAENGTLLLSTKEEMRLYSNADEIPASCGFGRLHYNIKNKSWNCVRSAPEYFGGIFCDEPQEKLTVQNKCLKVGHVDDLENTDVSTFNPLLQGVCVECSTKDANPAISSSILKCYCINKDEEEEDEEDRRPCFSDPTNPNFNSVFNKYVKGYGCSCDYLNGFVEARIGEFDELLSNACLKIGKISEKKDYYHKSHLAYYTLLNFGKPIQIHEYQELEQPYKSLFGGGKASLLVNQPTRDIVHKNDWLNTCVRPTSHQKLRRLKYPKADWLVVHKRHLVNHYKRRNETYPVSAFKVATGRGFETKHWYETTNNRYINNAVIGHPIMYGSNATDKIWNGRCTLNPLGPLHNKYYGLTMMYKPGSIVRLDTRGYNSEKKQNNRHTVTIAPNYETEMMDPKTKIYIPLLFNSYEVKNE